MSTDLVESTITPGVASIGFVGLGNVGGKLAGSVVRNGFDLVVHDLDGTLVDGFVAAGAGAAGTPRNLAGRCDVVITCLPSPAASSAVVEGPDGLLAGWGEGKIWLEMSTTDETEITRLASSLSQPVASRSTAQCREGAIAPPLEISRSLPVVSVRHSNACCRSCLCSDVGCSIRARWAQHPC